MSQVNPLDQAHAYAAFFRSEHGKTLLESIEDMEQRHIRTAQKDNSMEELNKSAGNREVLSHVTTVMAQVTDQAAE